MLPTGKDDDALPTEMGDSTEFAGNVLQAGSSGSRREACQLGHMCVTIVSWKQPLNSCNGCKLLLRDYSVACGHSVPPEASLNDIMHEVALLL